MIGQLVTTICERGRDAGTKSVEVWAFPDNSLNLVVECALGGIRHEFAFPCGLFELRRVVDGRPMQAEIGRASLRLERMSDGIVAWCRCDGKRWVQRVSLEDYLDSLAQLAQVTMAAVMPLPKDNALPWLYRGSAASVWLNEPT